MAIPQHPHLQRRESAQSRHGALGAPFLVGADQRVGEHDAEDHPRVAKVAHARGKRRGNDEDVDQRALELAQEHQEQRALRRFRQGVRAVLGAALRDG